MVPVDASAGKAAGTGAGGIAGALRAATDGGTSDKPAAGKDPLSFHIQELSGGTIAVFDGWIVVKCFVEESGLPTDGMDLLAQFIREVDVRSGQVTSVRKKKGAQKPSELSAIWRERGERLAGRRARVESLRKALEQPPAAGEESRRAAERGLVERSEAAQ